MVLGHFVEAETHLLGWVSLQEARAEFAAKRHELVREGTDAVRTQMSIVRSEKLLASYRGVGAEKEPDYRNNLSPTLRAPLARS